MRSLKLLLMLGLVPLLSDAQSSPAPQDSAPRKVIVSTDHPHDSLGEVVYSYQGADDQDVPVVPGVMLNPYPLSPIRPKYTKSMKKARFEGEVAIVGVVTPGGAMIDKKVVEPADPEAAAAAMTALGDVKFKPPSLNGRPVAMQVRIMVMFRLY